MEFEECAKTAIFCLTSYKYMCILTPQQPIYLMLMLQVMHVILNAAF